MIVTFFLYCVLNCCCTVHLLHQAWIRTSTFCCAYYTALLFCCFDILLLVNYFLLVLTTPARPFTAKNLFFLCIIDQEYQRFKHELLHILNCCTFWTAAQLKYVFLKMGVNPELPESQRLALYFVTMFHMRYTITVGWWGRLFHFLWWRVSEAARIPRILITDITQLTDTPRNSAGKH